LLKTLLKSFFTVLKRVIILLTGRIITCIVIALLAIQIFPTHQPNDSMYDDDSSEVCVSSIINDDGDLFILSSPVSLALDQQIISLNRFYIQCKIFPGFPVCIYSAYPTDIPTPPPDKAVS
jgi:hypothetical protein